MMRAPRVAPAGRVPGGPGPGPRPWILALALASALGAAGCGLFDPADPEPPFNPGPGISLPDLTIEPDSALYSLALGLEKKSFQLYVHAIAETTVVTDADFHAVFDPQDTLDYQVATGARPPQDWTSRDEKTFFSFFASLRPVTYSVYFLPDPARPDQRGQQVTTLYRRYRVFAGADPLAVGLADLTLRRVGVNQEWKIIYWVDRRDTSSTAVRTLGRRRLDSLSP